MTMTTRRLAEVFAVLKPDRSVEPVAVSPRIYQELDERFDAFKSHVLISEYGFGEDWPGWERHPAGDEVVVLLSGRVTMVLREPAGEACLTLSEPGAYLVVPKGVWHTARIAVASRMLFVTPGEGTEHAADPVPI